MPTTDDPNDSRLTCGPDREPGPQAPVYLVLSEQERMAGFVRPLRRGYVHKWVRDRESGEQLELGTPVGLTSGSVEVGGCGTETSMGLALCETYARQPTFYGSTYCVGCQMHRPVAEFRWVEDGAVVGS